MNARDEAAQLLVEHQWHDFTCVGWRGRDCGWTGQPQEHAGHLADVLEGSLLLRRPRPKSPEEMTGREMLDGLEAATRHEIQRMKRERGDWS